MATTPALRRARHPYSGALYEEQDDGTVRVSDKKKGTSGLFRLDGTWIAGDLTTADLHFLGFVGGPTPPPGHDVFWMLMPPDGKITGEGAGWMVSRETAALLDETKTLVGDYTADPGKDTEDGRRSVSFIPLDKVLGFERRPDLLPDVYRKSAPYPGGPKKVNTARFFSKEYHDREVEHLWGKTWQMACREEDIPEVGDHTIYKIADRSFIIVRTGEDEFKAYVNACLHRGRALSDCGGKKATGFRCPYHGWRWSIDGELKDLPAEWDFPGVREDAGHLPEAKVGTWGGFIFINPDLDACSLEEYIGPEMIEQYAKMNFRDRYRHAWVGKVLKANWKVVQEGFIESYHALATHPQLLMMGGDLTDNRFDVFGNWGRPGHASISISSPTRGMLATEEEAQASWYKSAEGMRTYLRSIIGDEAEQYSDTELNETSYSHLFPNFCPWSGWGRIMYRFRPHGDNPDECLMDIMLLAPWPKGKPRPAPAQLHMLADDESWTGAPEIGALGRIYDQDTRNFPGVQLGLKAKKPDHIWYSAYQESIIRAFHDRYEKRLGLAEGE